MQPVTALYLLVQATTTFIVLRRVRKAWASHLGALLLTAAFIYHGVTEAMQWWFPGRNFYRAMVNPADLHTWMAIITAAMILFAVAYLSVLGRVCAPAPQRTRRLADGLPSTPLLIGFAAVTFANFVAAQAGVGSYAVSGLARQFIWPIVVLAASAVAYRRPDHTVHALIAAASANALIGSRLEVATGTLATLGCLSLVGLMPRRRTLVWIGAAGLVVAVSISGARADVGRDAILRESALERVTTFGSGLSAANRDVILDDVVYRFDGNAAGAMITERLRQGAPATGVRPLLNSINLAIPRFLNPGKLASDVSQRSDKAYVVAWMGLPYYRMFVVPIDYLMPTTVIIYGYAGIPGLLIAMPLIGVAFGRIDRWLHRANSRLTLIVFVGLAQPVLQFERGMDVYFVTLRGLLVLAALLTVVHLATRFFSPRRSARTNDTVPLSRSETTPPSAHGLHAARMYGGRHPDS